MVSSLTLDSGKIKKEKSQSFITTIMKQTEQEAAYCESQHSSNSKQKSEQDLV